jgi:tRNA pseudouridine38-40 synthase
VGKYYYKFLLEYKGTGYFGWQIQPRQKTIQGQINQALVKLTKSSDLQTLGAGRTDAGVHAKAQVFKATLPRKLPKSALVEGLNSLLPPEIKILQVVPVSANFHPVRDALWKQYRYLFTNHQISKSPFFTDTMANIWGDLDFSLMKGCTGTEVPSTVRTIFMAELKTLVYEGAFECFDYFAFEVKGDGFLKQMVRLMMGALWSLGLRKISLERFIQAIENKVPGKVGPVAPPEGLYLEKIYYDPQTF